MKSLLFFKYIYTVLFIMTLTLKVSDVLAFADEISIISDYPELSIIKAVYEPEEEILHFTDNGVPLSDKPKFGMKVISALKIVVSCSLALVPAVLLDVVLKHRNKKGKAIQSAV